MEKIYFNQNTVYLTSPSKAEMLEGIDETYNFAKINDCEQFIKQIEAKNDQKKICLLHTNVFEMKQEILSHFFLIRAAGGVVKNDEQQTLFIRRFDRWDLPKGKIEKNEAPQQAAIREVGEECGISPQLLTLGTLIMPTYHSYYQQNRRILKETFWYRMTYAGNEPLVPQRTENITLVKWLDDAQLPEVYQNTYLSIIDILDNEFAQYQNYGKTA